jgi:hypothetical protein
MATGTGKTCVVLALQVTRNAFPVPRACRVSAPVALESICDCGASKFLDVVQELV